MRTLQKTLACLTAAMLALLPAYGLCDEEEVTKNEIVYATFSAEGQNGQYSIVNRFDVNKAQSITDYGQYSAVSNLSSEAQIEQSGDQLTFYADEGVFYYEGTVDHMELPWLITAQYLYNGAAIAPQDLAGQSGAVEIILSIKRNPACEKDYFKHYALSISTSFDTDNCTGIQAPGGIIANVGKSKQVSYTVVPDTEQEFHITLNALQFAMEPIAINGVPLSLDVGEVDTGSIKDDLNDLQDGVVKLDDGAATLTEGADELEDGVDSLSSGSTQVQAAMSALTKASNKLDGGAGDLWGGISALANAAKTLASYHEQLTTGAKKLTDTATQTKIATLNQLVAGYVDQLQKDAKALQTSMTTLGNVYLKDAYVELKTLQATAVGADGSSGYLGGALSANGAALTANSSASTSIADAINELQGDISQLEKDLGMTDAAKQQLDNQLAPIIAKLNSANVAIGTSSGAINQSSGAVTEIVNAINGDFVAKGVGNVVAALGELSNGDVKTYSDQLSADMTDYITYTETYRAYMNAINTGAQSLANGILQYIAGSSEFCSGVDTLNASYQPFNDGLATFTASIRKLASNYASLDAGVQALVDGVDELVDGVAELSDGTGEMRSRTDGMDTKVDDKVDEALEKFRNTDYVAPSFTSDHNSPALVQFVIKLRGIDLPAEETETEETTEPEKQTPLDRLKDLFANNGNLFDKDAFKQELKDFFKR
ncbi:MAG: hypothetical protein PHY12_05085 [Eubacteriales bacterium]|nr:hypothetical protein [Eubacteriales bacterium]